MRGKIEQVQKSKSGKTLGVRIGEVWYSSKNWELEGMANEMIEFEVSLSEFNGNTIKWINEYRAVDNSPDPNNPVHSSANSRPAGVPAAAPTGRDPSAYLPMTSNLVAHAIAAGLITKPDQIESWAAAAFSAAKQRLEPTQVGDSGSEGFDDDIPF